MWKCNLGQEIYQNMKRKYVLIKNNSDFKNVILKEEVKKYLPVFVVFEKCNGPMYMYYLAYVIKSK